MVSVLNLVETNGTEFTPHIFPDEMKEVWLVVSTDGVVREYYMSLVHRNMTKEAAFNSNIIWYLRLLLHIKFSGSFV